MAHRKRKTLARRRLIIYRRKPLAAAERSGDSVITAVRGVRGGADNARERVSTDVSRAVRLEGHDAVCARAGATQGVTISTSPRGGAGLCHYNLEASVRRRIPSQRYVGGAERLLRSTAYRANVYCLVTTKV